MRYINRQVVIARACKFIDEITHGLKCIAVWAISPRIQRRAQFFEQPGFSTLRQRIGNDGVDGEVSAIKTVHGVLLSPVTQNQPGRVDSKPATLRG